MSAFCVPSCCYYQKHFFFQLWQKTKIPRNPFTIDFDKLQNILELWESITDSFYQLLRLYYMMELQGIVVPTSFTHEQSPVCKAKKLLQKLCENQSKTPMLESLFNKVVGWQLFYETLPRGCFYFIFASFLQKASGACFWNWRKQDQTEIKITANLESEKKNLTLFEYLYLKMAWAQELLSICFQSSKIFRNF